MKVLVIGASLNESRYSNKAIRMLLKFNHIVKTIGLKSGNVSDVAIQKEKLHFDQIHTVTIYINPEHQTEYYDYIISLNPKRVIFNPGTENRTFYQKLEQAQIPYEASCTLVLLQSGLF